MRKSRGWFLQVILWKERSNLCLIILLAEAKTLPKTKLYKRKFISATLIFSMLPRLPFINSAASLSSGFIPSSSLLFKTCSWKLLRHIMSQSI